MDAAIPFLGRGWIRDYCANILHLRGQKYNLISFRYKKPCMWSVWQASLRGYVRTVQNNIVQSFLLSNWIGAYFALVESLLWQLLLCHLSNFSIGYWWKGLSTGKKRLLKESGRLRKSNGLLNSLLKDWSSKSRKKSLPWKGNRIEYKQKKSI